MNGTPGSLLRAGGEWTSKGKATLTEHVAEKGATEDGWGSVLQGTPGKKQSAPPSGPPGGGREAGVFVLQLPSAGAEGCSPGLGLPAERERERSPWATSKKSQVFAVKLAGTGSFQSA